MTKKYKRLHIDNEVCSKSTFSQIFNLQVEEVRAWKEELLSERKETIERKMQRAEEKRQMQIKQIVRKAHEEETKVNYP